MRELGGVVLGLALLAAAPRAGAAEVLSVGAYLGQVASNNQGVAASRDLARSADGAESEASLFFRPQVFGTANWGQDAQQVPLASFDRLDTQSFAFGLQQQTDFGLQGKLYYGMNHIDLMGLDIPGLGSLGTIDAYDSGPTVQLSLSLWSNGLGRSARAQQRQMLAGSRLQRQGARLQDLATQVQAENAYWRLAAAREAVGIQAQALAQAQAILDNMNHKAQMKLGEPSDALQAQGLVALRRLALKGAQSEALSALKEFNSQRGKPCDTDPGDLEPLPYQELLGFSPSAQKPGHRLDVAMAQSQAELAAAGAVVVEERNKPSLDIYGAYGLSTLGGGYDSFENGVIDGKRDAQVGLRFNAPLDVLSSYRVREGARLNVKAQQEQWEQKQTMEDKDWALLAQQIRDAKESLELAGQLVEAQQAKLLDGRKRLEQGRAITNEVLMFEQDQSQAKLQRLQLAQQLLSLRAALKLYSADDAAKAGE
jgi:outer membrane protein TolC